MSQRSISQLFINPLGLRFKNVFATLSLCAAVALASNTAVAQQPEQAHQTDSSASYGLEVAAATPAAQRKAAIDSTEAFINAHKQWAQARGASNKAVALQSLIEKAEARREMLAELIRTNPAEALRVAIPDEKQVGMPTQVLELLELQVELDGEVEAFFEDYEDGSHKLRQFLKTPFGERFELHGSGKSNKIPNGTKVRVNGLLLSNLTDATGSDGDLTVGDTEDSLVFLAANGDATTVSTVPSAATNTFGEQRTLVILANFQDNPVQPWTKADAENVVFGTVNDFYKENSSQQTWLSGDVVGWLTLPLDSVACDGNSATIFNAFYEAAEANGIDVSAYSRHIYMFPTNSNCRWGGLGSYGGSPSQALVNGLRDATTAHELGHNMGLSHARALECGSSTLGSNCSSVEYGDITDVMGKTFVHFNPYHKEKLGWLTVAPVSSSGVFTVETYAAPGSSTPKALKVLKSQDPISGKKTFYYLSLRQGYGIDSYLAGSDNIQQGITIQTGLNSTADESFLLDMTPGSGGTNADFYDPALTSGNSFSDPDAGVTIQTLGVSTGQADVFIDMGQSSCVQANPAISLSPSTQWATAGSTALYNVTITNKDSANCGSSAFNLAASAPSGWGSSFSNATLTLTPGASATTTMAITSATSAVSGFNNITVTAASGSYNGTVTATYVIDTPTSTNSAPVAVNDSATLASVSAITITALANDWDPEGDALTVQGVTQGAKGSVRINSDGSLTYTPGKRFKNADSFSYTISDGARTASATVSVQLQKSTGGSNGKGNGKNR